MELKKVASTTLEWELHLKYPALWTSGIELHQCIDIPMHQIFLGLVKGLIDFIGDWFKSQNKYKPFIRSIQVMVDRIADLGLSWCKLEKFSDSDGTGGWVAESYLGYSRLLPVLYGDVNKIVDPNSFDTKPFLCLVQSAYALICRIMTMPSADGNTVNEYVKLFLSCCHFMSPSNSTPWWDKGNLLSLLNIGDQIDFYGHVRFYWEGNRERYVQVVKPLLTSLRNTDTYFTKKLKDLHIQNSLRELLTASNCYGQWIKEKVYIRHHPVHIYSSRQSILDSIDNNKPISATVDKKGKTSICVQHTSSHASLYSVSWSDTGTLLCGIWYSGLEIEQSFCGLYSLDPKPTENIDVDYALLISSPVSVSSPMYALLTMNWYIRDTWGKLSLFTLSKECFSEYIN